MSTYTSPSPQAPPATSAVIRSDADEPATWSTFATPELPREGCSPAELAAAALSPAAGTALGAARGQAQAQGFAIGWAEGRRNAQREADNAAREAEARDLEREARRQLDHQATLAALTAALEHLHTVAVETRAAITAQASELAMALTETLVAHDVSSDPAAHAVRRVLSLAPPPGTAAEPGASMATVRLHPAIAEDAGTLALTQHGLRVVADPTLALGDAVVEADGSLTDLGLDAAIARVRQALTSSDG